MERREAFEDRMEEAEAIARAFHEKYEALAPRFAYKTREASAVPWEEVPTQNKALMVGVVAELLQNGIISGGIQGG